MKTSKPKEILDGFDIYAPALIESSSTFISDAHSNLEEYEKNYFWFSERRELIYFMVKKYFFDIKSYCEIGCGGGYILSEIHSIIPAAKLYGSEIFLSGLQIARKRQENACYFQSDILNFPYKDEFDLIGVYDVIEHIDSDQDAIKSIYDALSDGGGAIITVPQHKWLWTENDNYSCHKRRYVKKDLVKKCKDAGFEVIRTTSYTSLLLPAFIINCLFNRRNSADTEEVAKQFEINPALNYLFKLICKIELLLTIIGINFPCGGSLVCVVRKN